MAYRAYDQRQQRSLVLTFNKALVADMRRTMALLGVPRSVEKGGIGIETVHSFLGRLMLKLGVIKDYSTFLDDYESHKETLLSYLRSGAVTRGDVDDLIKADASEFDWDLVFVDEGQDWPGNEIAILNAMYGSERLIVSDGIDQYVRDSVADWSLGLGKGGVRTRRLTKCLRMKTNLALFVGDMAEALGLDDWDLEANADAPGGRVIVVEGNLAADPALVGRLRDEAMGLGNWPVDMLACVPPSSVRRSNAKDLCAAAAEIVRSGGSVWDGTARDVREHYPTQREELRFVQYDSCRGLEGWTTINYGLDEFWDYKHMQWFTEDHGVDGLFQTAEELARLHASRWVMIPLTRAIDTLVINVTGAPGLIKTALMKVCRQRGDFVEWIKLAA